MSVRRAVAALAAGIAVATAVRAPAGAHVEPNVTEVRAGAPVTVDFVVEHGCDGSPTVALEFQVPEEVADATPVKRAGWTGAVEGRVVSFRGGPQPADEPATFSVTFTAPDDPGAVLAFPFVQTCEEGRIDWIQVGGAQMDRPAPLVRIAELQAATGASGTTPTGGADTTPTDPSGATTDPAADPAADAAAGSGGVLVVGALLMTAVAVGFGVWLRRREG